MPNSRLLYLSRAEVEAVALDLPTIIQRLEEAFREKSQGKVEMPPKPGIHPGADNFIHALPAYIPALHSAGIKWVAGFPGNAQRGLPYITGLIVLNKADTGLPYAVMDCTWITAYRTGAKTAIAARYLARPNSETAGILACGTQGRTNLLGGVRLELGQYPDAEDHFEEALKLSRTAADRIGEAMELANLGQLYGKQGDYGRERAYLLESLPIAQNSSEPRMYAKSLCDLGFNSYLLGEYTPARDLYERSLAILRAGGDRAWEAETLVKLSLLLHRLGNLTQARCECEQALTIARSIDHREYQGMALTQLGHLAAAEHKWAEAETYYQEALALRQTLGLHQGLIEILAGQAWLAAQQGQVERAKVILEAIFDDLQINPTLVGAIEPVRILLTCYHSLTRLGDERARQILDTAYGLLQAQAARITDSQLRTSFLQNVPTHVELAARWLSSQ